MGSVVTEFLPECCENQKPIRRPFSFVHLISNMVKMDLARYIDHTILKADCSLDAIHKVCEEALEFGFAAVCIPPFFVKEAAQMLEHSKTKVATVVGFPLGYAATPSKVEEVKRAIDEGASELDAVVNLCALKSSNWNFVRNEMDSLVTACHMRGKILKVIFETGLLTQAEILKLCQTATEADVDFVKTSTGYNGEGATVAVVEMLRKNLPKNIKIKASGGIRDRQTVEAMIAAGANRIGTSASVDILKNG